MTSFRRFLARRLALAMATILGVIVTVFILTFLLPGDIAALKLGQYATEETLAAMRREMGTDQPPVVQFVNYVKKLSRGDMGMSWVSGNPVRKDLSRRLPATLELGLAAIAIGVLIGHVLGILAAVRQDTFLDEIVRGYAVLGASTAVFWLALVLIYVFYFRLRWAPPPMGRLDLAIEVPPAVTGLYVVDSSLARDWTALRNSVAHVALPAVALGFVVSAPITKMVRAAMLDVLHSDFVRTARAVGVPYRQVVLQDGLRNAWIPILTSIGISFSYLMAGNVLVEQIFAWPGLGQYAWQALTSKDFDALRGFIVVVAVMYVIINLVVDLLYALIDPRIRLG